MNKIHILVNKKSCWQFYWVKILFAFLLPGHRATSCQFLQAAKSIFLPWRWKCRIYGDDILWFYGDDILWFYDIWRWHFMIPDPHLSKRQSTDISGSETKWQMCCCAAMELKFLGAGSDLYATLTLFFLFRAFSRPEKIFPQQVIYEWGQRSSFWCCLPCDWCAISPTLHMWSCCC